jgi:hypothetical protein
MKRATTVIVSLLDGALVGLLVTVALTALLAPYLWPAPLVSLPTAVVEVWSVEFVYVWLTYLAAGGLAAATFTGVPAGIVGALVAGYLATRTGGGTVDH